MSPTFLRFLKYARPYWRPSLGSVAFGAIKFSLALLLPGALGLVVKYALDTDLTSDEQAGRLFGILALLVAAFLLRAPITFYRTYWAEFAGNRTIFDIRSHLYRHIQRLSLTYHADNRTGSTISRLINDINAAQTILDRGVITVVIDLLFLSGVVTLLFSIDWRLAAVSLITLPIYGFSIMLLNPRHRRASMKVQEQVSEMSGEVTEKLSGLSVVLAFVREKTEERHFFQRHRDYFDRVLTKTKVQATHLASTEFLTAAGPLVVIGYGGYRMIDGTLAMHEFIWFYGFISHLYLPTRRLADCTAMVQESLAALDRVFELMDETPDIRDLPDAPPLRNAKGHVELRNVHFGYTPDTPVLHDISLVVEPGQSVAIVGRSGAGKSTLVNLWPRFPAAPPLRNAKGHVELRNVHFGYTPDTPVLHDISLVVEPGQSVAIVGRSGAGKSTLVNLLPRFYDVSLGQILVDGQDISKVRVKSLREHIGIVQQDSILFRGTIGENILYGRRDATHDEMLEAAKMAHVDEFVDEFKEGYETVIGERGVKLSGGQKQRVSIARAFLRDPRILILDEATSSLDSQAENIIQDALRELMEGRTTFVIAHRLSTIVDSDIVIVLEDGRIVQQGQHDDLIQRDGMYRHLCEEQFGYVRLDGLAR